SHCEQCHCELFFLLRSVKQSLSSCSTPVKQPRKGSVLGFQPHEPHELYEPYEPYELNKLSFLATVPALFDIES
ncbi:hypothetical protein KAW18_10830, partial [candidate division WOR-3 bacterium]|nr:hypothetical protein [candidate division WOR-3 bacterium]